VSSSECGTAGGYSGTVARTARKESSTAVATQQQRHLHHQEQQNKSKLYLHTVHIQGCVIFERIVLWKEPFLFCSRYIAVRRGASSGGSSCSATELQTTAQCPRTEEE